MGGMWDKKPVREIFDILRVQAAAVFAEELANTRGGPLGHDKAWAKVDQWVIKALLKIEFYNHPEVNRDARD